MTRILFWSVFIVVPLAGMLIYARVVEPGEWPLLAYSLRQGPGLDPASLIVGAIGGYAIALVLRFPWKELPERICRWLNRLVPGVQLALCAVVCVAVLVYW